VKSGELIEGCDMPYNILIGESPMSCLACGNNGKGWDFFVDTVSSSSQDEAISLMAERKLITGDKWCPDDFQVKLII
jgi:hypothetical protein